MSENKTAVTLEEYNAALTKIGAQGTQITQLKAQLQEATDALTIIKAKFDAAEVAEKEDVINELVKDSNGKLTREVLVKDSLKDLYLRKDTIALAEPKSFVSVMRQREQDAQKPKTLGSNGTGTYNQSTGKWEGGLSE